MGRKRKNNKIPKVHQELEGLDMTINAFGEIISNIDMDKVNKFLTENVPDKKLINRLDNKYQQEFREMGLGGEDEDEPEYIEPAEEEEDDFESLMGDGKAEKDKEDEEKKKDKE